MKDENLAGHEMEHVILRQQLTNIQINVLVPNISGKGPSPQTFHRLVQAKNERSVSVPK